MSYIEGAQELGSYNCSQKPGVLVEHANAMPLKYIRTYFVFPISKLHTMKCT
jgi:hypothetical protein